MIRHLPLVWKNSMRSRRRTALTVLSIAASLCLLGVLMALYHAFYLREASPDQALRLVVQNRISLTNPLPRSYIQKIAAVPGVDEVMALQWFGGVYKDARDLSNFFARFSVDADKLFQVYPDYRISDEHRQAFLNERTACVVGRKLSERLGFRLGDRIVLQGDIFPVNLELTVRGFYDSDRDNENLFFHDQYLRESLPEGRRDLVGTFVIRAETTDDVPRIAQAVDAMFRNSTLQTKTDTERAFELSFVAFLGNVKLFLLGIGGAVMFTILLVSGNTMAMAVRERVREVGVLKTLGFTRGAILGLILGEAVVIASVGGALGLGLAVSLCALMRQAPSTFTDMSRIAVPPIGLGFGMLLAAAIGLASSLIPAWNASRRSIVDSLRFTD